MFTTLKEMMIGFLDFSYNSIYPNYGLAIILLTVAVKLVFAPLTHKQFKSMKKMQELQPIIKGIQEKYKKQPEKLQKALIDVYKTHKANPLSGCLPTLVQIPFFFAIFYSVTSESFKATLMKPEINAGLFPFWLGNLGMPDNTFILPALIAASTYFSQKLMTIDPKQAKLFAFMPVLMFFISLKMPAGALLYWAASQIISTGQQYLMLKTSGQKPAELKGA